MSWLALHTAPSIDPHCTLAWWPDDVDQDYEAWGTVVRIGAKITKPYEAWMYGYEKFGVKKDIEVAVLYRTPVLDQILEMAAPLSRSEFTQRPHVTAHRNKSVWSFAYVGLHLPHHHYYVEFHEGV